MRSYIYKQNAKVVVRPSFCVRIYINKMQKLWSDPSFALYASDASDPSFCDVVYIIHIAFSEVPLSVCTIHVLHIGAYITNVITECGTSSIITIVIHHDIIVIKFLIGGTVLIRPVLVKWDLLCLRAVVLF